MSQTKEIMLHYMIEYERGMEPVTIYPLVIAVSF